MKDLQENGDAALMTDETFSKILEAKEKELKVSANLLEPFPVLFSFILKEVADPAAAILFQDPRFNNGFWM